MGRERRDGRGGEEELGELELAQPGTGPVGLGGEGLALKG